VVLTLTKVSNDENLRRCVQALFLPYGDGTAMGLAVIRGECLPSVLADWIEDHLHLFPVGPLHPAEPAIRLVAEWLRLTVGEGVVLK
jgi:hypothetical protein